MTPLSTLCGAPHTYVYQLQTMHNFTIANFGSTQITFLCLFLIKESEEKSLGGNLKMEKVFLSLARRASISQVTTVSGMTVSSLSDVVLTSPRGVGGTGSVRTICATQMTAPINFLAFLKNRK
jgi:hypothetical protein